MSYITGFVSAVTVTQTLTGNSGGPVSPSGNNISIVGAGGITVAGNPGTATLTISSSGSGMTWNEVLGTSQSMASNNAYVANNASLVTLTLPATAAFGDVIQVVGKGSGLWKIAQNAGQSINFASTTTTVGVGGSISCIDRFDAMEIVCTTANTGWTVYSSVGNFTLV